MTTTQAQQAAKIDALMEQASQALVGREYFECERLAATALRRAHAISDYERMSRILLPLQEARRQKRDMAIDSGRVALVDQELPSGRALGAGCYLVAPPRVGVDGRALREMADHKRVAAVVIVREPTTRDGLWPIVAVGPITLRAKVPPPESRPARQAKGKSKKPAEPAEPADPLPTPEWFLHACEQLGDAAIAAVVPTLAAAARVDTLLERLEALPDHEKLHQALEAAAREAVLDPGRRRRPMSEELIDELDADDAEEDGDDL